MNISPHRRPPYLGLRTPSEMQAAAAAACQVYCQPIFEAFDKTFGLILAPVWCARNVAVRLVCRTAFIAFTCFLGAMVRSLPPPDLAQWPALPCTLQPLDPLTVSHLSPAFWAPWCGNPPS
jgi:hypothetical protein